MDPVTSPKRANPKVSRRQPGTIYSRIALLFDCFARLGATQSKGQTQLAHEMKISPQVIRRRAADARHHRHPRGMPLDQLKQMAMIAVRDIPPLRDVHWQVVVAWAAGLDDLVRLDAKALESWIGEPSAAATRKKESKPRKKRAKNATAA